MINMVKIEAIAVDIDGTITDYTRRLCKSSIDALRLAEENNVPVIIVTGNVVNYAYATAVLIGCSGGVVAENGGVVFKESYNNDRVKKLVSKEYVSKAVDHLYNKLGSKLDSSLSSDEEYRESETVFYKTIDKQIILDALKDFEDLDKIEIYDSGFAIHITDIRVNKGSSLKFLCEETNIDINHVMAIGDSENDEDFLKVAGLKVAVSNAEDELKEISDYVCEKPYGDGVKEAVEKFVLNKG